MRQLLTALFMVIGLSWAGPVAAHALELEEYTCTGGAASSEEALALLPSELVCEGKRFDRTERFVRTSTKLQERYLPPRTGLVWQAIGSEFDSMLVRFNYADGVERLVDVDRQMPARNWFAGNRFNVPVPIHSAPLVSIDAVIERPESRATIRRFRLMEADHMAEEHFTRGLVYAIVLGLLIIPVIYDILFYRILRQPFVLWHFAMTASMAAFTVLHSGLIFIVDPDFGQAARWWGMVLSFVGAVSTAVMVVSGLIEERVLSRRMHLALIGAAIIPPIVVLATILGGEALRITGNQLMLLSFIPAAILLLGALLVAMAKGSRGAYWALLGLGGLIVVGAFRLLQGLEILALPFPIEDMIFGAMVLLAIFTAFGVGDRFLILRQQRDRAQLKAIKLGQMVNTDGLTGLANRRAFDMIGRLKPGQGLLVADVDHFKTINDNHGHQVGDAVLCHLASVLRGALSDLPSARVFRLGGEEFAILVHATSHQELRDRAEELRETVAASVALGGDFNLPPTTISIGAVLGEGQMMHQAFADADAALYRAKETGRDRTVLYPLGETSRGKWKQMRRERLGG